MKRVLTVFLALHLCWAAPLGGQEKQTAAIRGFAASRVEAEFQLEQKLQSVPSPESTERHLRSPRP